MGLTHVHAQSSLSLANPCDFNYKPLFSLCINVHLIESFGKFNSRKINSLFLSLCLWFLAIQFINVFFSLLYSFCCRLSFIQMLLLDIGQSPQQSPNIQCWCARFSCFTTDSDLNGFFLSWFLLCSCYFCCCALGIFILLKTSPKIVFELVTFDFECRENNLAWL